MAERENAWARITAALGTVYTDEGVIVWLYANRTLPLWDLVMKAERLAYEAEGMVAS